MRSFIGKRLEVYESAVGLMAIFWIGYAPTVALVVVGLINGVVDHKWLLATVSIPGIIITWKLARWVAGMGQHAFYTCFPNAMKTEAQQLTLHQVPMWHPFFGFLQLAPEASSGGIPLAVVMGTAVPRLSWWFRPLLAIWWLMHFAAGAIVGATIGYHSAITEARSGWVGQFLVPTLFATPFVFAANVYFLLAVALFRNDIRFLKSCWRWRLLLDVIVVAVPIGVSMWLL